LAFLLGMFRPEDRRVLTLLLCAIIADVKINKSSPSSPNSWIKKPFLAHAYHAWLIDDGSLTARLQQRYRDFSVKTFMVKHAKPSQEESGLLHMPNAASVLIREVLLYGNGRPVVFAHSILPRSSLRGEWRGLGRLGNKPLGATLFANPKVKRTPLNFKKLAAQHALYQAATRGLTEKPEYLWARRSVFSLNCANILVTEVFLPELIKA